MVLLAVMIAGGIVSDIYLSRVSENISEYSEAIAGAALKEDYEALNAAYRQLDGYWKKNEMPLAALLDHAHISEINKSLSELEVGIEAQEITEVLLADARVRTTMEMIPNNEHFHMKNIL